MNPQTNVNVNPNTNSFLKDSDLIFHMGKNGNVYSGGFAIDSSFMKNGIMTGGLYDKDSDVDSDSDRDSGPAASTGNIFTCGKFVVPPLWFHQEVHAPKISYSYDSDDDEEHPVVDETLYNKLLDMVRHGEAKHGEAKHGNAKKRNTKKASTIAGEKRKYTRKHRKPESESDSI
jgi:hypothetical protein